MISRVRRTTAAAVGAAGAATGNITFELTRPMRLLAVTADFSAAVPATADIRVTANGRSFVASANNAADRMLYPSEQATDAAGAVIAGSAVEPIIYGTITVALEQANAGDTAIVDLVLSDT